MLGDINIDISNDSYDINKHEYLNCMTELGFYQCIFNFTRVTDNSASCIDHIFIRTYSIKSVESFIYCSGITDHYVVGLIIQNNETKVNNIYNTKKVDWNTLLNQLSLVNWNNILNEVNVDNCANNFHNILMSSITESTYTNHYYTSAKKQKLKPWMTSGLLISIRKRDKFNLKAKKAPPGSNIIKYLKKYKNKLCSLIRLAKNLYYKNIINKNIKNTKKYGILLMIFLIERIRIIF